MNRHITSLVSVGMTTYNNSTGLDVALNSIVKQTYKNIEIIISDDCSPGQDTQEIVNKYASEDKRIKYIRQKKNIGPAANTKFVLMQATGEYFMWADDDDFRDSQWIEVLLRKLSHKNVISSLGKVIAIDETDNTTQICKPIQFSGPRVYRLVNYYLAEETSGKACIACGLFRTKFVRNIKHWGEYEINKYGYGDNYFSFDCLQYGDVIADQSVIIYKRMPKGNKENEKKNKSLDILSNTIVRLKLFSNYISVATHLSDKFIISILFPIKCIKNIVFFTIRRVQNII